MIFFGTSIVPVINSRKTRIRTERFTGLFSDQTHTINDLFTCNYSHMSGERAGESERERDRRGEERGRMGGIKNVATAVCAVL